MDTEVKKALDLRLANGKITLAEYKELLRTIADNEVIGDSNGETPDSQPSSRRDENLQPILVVDQDLSFFNAFLMHKGKKYLYSEIESLSYSLSRFTFNLVPMSNMSFFSIAFDNGYTISYSTDTTFVRGKKSKLLEQAYQFLQKVTGSQRVEKVFSKLRKNGFIDIPSLPPVRLYFDGTIEDEKQQRLNLRECMKNNTFAIGMNYGYGLNMSCNPDEVRLQETQSQFCKKKIVFTICSNQDVYRPLIARLAQPKK